MAKISPAADAAPAPNWRYTGPPGRIYTHIPVTPQPGDVVAWPQIPAGDGAWEPTGDDVTRRPDNWHPTRYNADAPDIAPDPPATPAAQVDAEPTENPGGGAGD